MRTKNKMKNYLKLGILLFGVSIFFNSCYEDDNITIEKETKFFKMLYHTPFSKVKNKKIIKKTTEKLLLRDLSKTNSENGFVIDTTSVQVLISDYYTNYTFVANMNTVDSTFLNNYVLTIFNDSIYHQMLISYPIITNGNEISYDAENSIAEEIDGDMLIQKSVCNGYRTTQWVDGVGHNCNAGGNHPPGTPCNDGVMRSWTEPGSWVTTCTQHTIITEAPPEGGTAGGGLANNPLYNIVDPYDGNIIIGATPFNTKPPIDENQQTKTRLLELVNTPVISDIIDELIPDVNSSTSGNYFERGFRFKFENNTYTPRQATEVYAHKVSYNPPYEEKETVSLHIHTTEWLNNVNGVNYNHPNSPIFSETDITDFLDQVDFIDGTNPELTDDVTSLLMTEKGLFALVVKDKDKADNAQTFLEDDDNYNKFKKDFEQDVLDDWNNDIDNNTELIKKFKRFLKRHRLNGQKMGIDLYQAEIDGNNVTGWQKL